MAMTPALRFCEREGVDIEVRSFAHDSANTHYGEEAAAALGVDPNSVFKTLMVEGDTRHYALALVPVPTPLDLKHMAIAMGVKRVNMADAKVVQSRSGYVLGGVSPLAHKQPCPLYLDESAQAFGRIWVSAGRRGLELGIAPEELLRLSGGHWARLAVE